MRYLRFSSAVSGSTKPRCRRGNCGAAAALRTWDANWPSWAATVEHVVPPAWSAISWPRAAISATLADSRCRHLPQPRRQSKLFEASDVSWHSSNARASASAHPVAASVWWQLRLIGDTLCSRTFFSHAHAKSRKLCGGRPRPHRPGALVGASAWRGARQPRRRLRQPRGCRICEAPRRQRIAFPAQLCLSELSSKRCLSELSWRSPPFRCRRTARSQRRLQKSWAPRRPVLGRLIATPASAAPATTEQ